LDGAKLFVIISGMRN